MAVTRSSKSSSLSSCTTTASKKPRRPRSSRTQDSSQCKRQRGPKSRGHKGRSSSPSQEGELDALAAKDREIERLTAVLSQLSRAQGDEGNEAVQATQQHVPTAHNNDHEEDFGLRPLMHDAAGHVSRSNDHGETEDNMEVDPAPSGTSNGETGLLGGAMTVTNNVMNHRNANARVGANQSGSLQCQHTKVPRPFGTAGRHFNLQKEMGLQSNRDLYNQIQRETRWAFNQANLPLVPFKHQDHQAIFAITQSMKERFPCLEKFIRPAVWPVIEMIKMLLRNRRAYHKVMGIPVPEANSAVNVM